MQKIDATDKHVEKVCAGVAAAAAQTESLLDSGQFHLWMVKNIKLAYLASSISNETDKKYKF